MRAHTAAGWMLGALAAVGGGAALAFDGAAGGAVAGGAGVVASGVAVLASRRAESLERQRVVAQAEVDAGREALDLSLAHVRSLEVALERPVRQPPPDPEQLLNDAETGLPGRAYFAVNLDARLEAARRNLRPVAIVLIEIADPSGLPADPRFVATTLRATFRAADAVCRLDGDSRFAVILEDTAEQGAVWTVDRFRRALTARATKPHVLSVGIACYPAHGLDTEGLRRRAVDALAAARHWRQDRIEIATADA